MDLFTLHNYCVLCLYDYLKSYFEPETRPSSIPEFSGSFCIRPYYNSKDKIKSILVKNSPIRKRGLILIYFIMRDSRGNTILQCSSFIMREDLISTVSAICYLKDRFFLRLTNKPLKISWPVGCVIFISAPH